MAIFFLVQVISSPHESFAETCALNPPTKVSLNNPDICFKQVYEVFYLVLSIYKSDAVEKRPKETLLRELGTLFDSEVRFDIEHIDIGKKGWTRYYPFCIDGKSFIARIFLTGERAYQPEVAVLFEAIVEDPSVTIQILPGINAILKDCNIRPYNFYPVSQAATSP